MFKTKRDLIEIQDHYQSYKKNTKFRPLEQRYGVDMFVNHAMTHMIHEYSEIELSQGMENPTSGLKVINSMQETWRDLRQRMVSLFIGN